jgi:hypothetical protein
MALNFDLTKVKNREFLDNKENASTIDMLIYCTMFVGMGEITEKNFVEFFTRVHLLEKVNGTFLKQFDGDKLNPHEITLDDVRNMIGLKTNVSTETRAKFMKRNLDGFFQDIARQIDAGKVK